MLGVSTSTAGERDTLGLFVSAVTPGGPAEKAGIEEGHRIAAINGVSLLPMSRTLDMAKKLVELRATLTVDAIKKAMGK